jgi:hypothetical protein
LYRLGKDIFTLSLGSIFYNNAGNKNYMNYIMLRELGLHTSRIFILFFLYLIFIFFNLKTTDLISENVIILLVIIAISSVYLTKQLKIE